MWKKDEKKDEGEDRAPEQRGEKVRSAPSGRSSTPAAEQATIGSSIKIRGEVTGDEDLLIQGYVDGSVELAENSLTVGPDGEVKASIAARVITVEGRVDGDISAEEQIVLRSSARVEGDIVAPRVVLEDGARFRGSVDMGERSERGRAEGKEPSRAGTGGSSSAGSGSDSGSGSAASGRSGSGKGSLASAASSEGGDGKSGSDSAVEATT
jgi:cytoskeletal protein CcmA (bactofilin family)